MNLGNAYHVSLLTQEDLAIYLSKYDFCEVLTIRKYHDEPLQNFYNLWRLIKLLKRNLQAKPIQDPSDSSNHKTNPN